MKEQKLLQVSMRADGTFLDVLRNSDLDMAELSKQRWTIEAIVSQGAGHLVMQFERTMPIRSGSGCLPL